MRDVVELLIKARRTGKWGQPPEVPADVRAADEAVRVCCGVFEIPNADVPMQLYVEGCLAMTIDEIHASMRKGMPGLTREKLRKLLHKANREGSMHRVKRGVYVEDSRMWRRLKRSRELMEDESEQGWEARYERQSFMRALVLVAHYLLHRRASYRKAREIGISDRTYFYWLGSGLEDFGDWVDSSAQYARKLNVHS